LHGIATVDSRRNAAVGADQMSWLLDGSDVVSLVRCELRDRVATVVIDRPERRNAMTRTMVESLLKVIARFGQEPEARVIVVTGAKGAFCAGTDLSVPAEIEPAHQAIRLAMESVDGWWPLVACPKPVIAAIDGPAVGMGAELASHCDVRIASSRAWFAWNFVHRGLVPDTGAGTWLLPRLIGASRALELLATGRRLGAAEAANIGFVSRVVKPRHLSRVVRDQAGALARVSPVSTRLTKRLLYEGLSRDPSLHLSEHMSAFGEALGSRDHAEAVAAFRERRDARFTGR
jgi:enoyl-CoA hydratase